MSENMIQVENISKSFKDVKAVRDISFRVRRGELFAFLGVNGAGKSTTISMICGQLSADRGRIYVNGLDTAGNSVRVRETLGVVFQDSVLDRQMSGRENLKSRAALYGIHGKVFEARLEELIRIFQLKEFIDRPYGKLSGGQRRRLDIARALVHGPELLILDEPTTGLDPQTRKMIWDILRVLREKEGLTVFLTTHYMEEAAEAGYVVIIDHGQIAAEGTPHDLKNTYVRDTLLVYGIGEADVQKFGRDYEKIRDGYRLLMESPEAATELICRYPELFRDYEFIKGGMDDVFLNVTGRELGGEQA